MVIYKQGEKLYIPKNDESTVDEQILYREAYNNGYSDGYREAKDNCKEN